MTNRPPQVFVNGVADAGGESVQYKQPYEQTPYAGLVMSLATVADDITAWGLDPIRRDLQLRSFWPTEPILASAIYSIVARDSAFSWTLEGPPRTVNAVQDKLHTAENGEGWQAFIMKFRTDQLTQDNGGFIEVIRSGPNEGDPVTGLAHLDAGRCRRTGVEEWPVVYTDRVGVLHKLRPWQVIAWAEFPSPVETMNGVGLSAVSRVLRAAQFLRDVGIFQREKVGGRNPGAVYLVGGINTSMIQDAVRGAQVNADNRGLARYLIPIIIGSVDPTAAVKVDKIDLASLPDGFDPDVVLRWYIAQLALGFGADYQDFAPLPGGNLGSSAQSVILHQKSRGKGPALFMKGLEYRFNFHGIMPRNVTFRYDEQDAAADMEQAELRKLRAEARSLDVLNGVLTPEAARQQMVDDGDLSPELFDALQTQPDLTTDVVAQDDEREEETPPPTAGVGAPPASPAPAVPPLPAAQKDAASDFAEADRKRWGDEYRAVMVRALRQAFTPLQRAILDAGNKGLLERLISTKEEDTSAVAPNVQQAMQDPDWWAAFRRGMIDGASPTFRAVTTGAAQYNADLGLPVNMQGVNQAVLDLTRTYTDEWWNEIETATRTAMRSAFVNWQEGRLGSAGLPDLVDALTPWFGEMRAERIAATEITRMFDMGNKLAHEEAGIMTEEWQTVRDESVCPICSPLNGQRFATNEGPRPPAHVNCRCARLPVANDQTIGGR